MAKFGTIEVYEEMAKLLNDDATWAEKGQAISYSMTYKYTDPVNKAFYVNFDAGKVVDVRELDADDDAPVDFLLTGAPDIWRGILEKTLSPTAAMTKGQLRVKGKMTTLLKNMDAFSYVIDAMTKIELA